MMTNTQKTVTLDGIEYELTFEQVVEVMQGNFVSLDMDTHFDYDDISVNDAGMLIDEASHYELSTGRPANAASRLIEDATELLIDYSNSKHVWDESSYEEIEEHGDDNTPF